MGSKKKTTFEDLFGDSAESLSQFSDVLGSAKEDFPDPALLESLIEEGIHESALDDEIRFPGYHPSEISSNSCVRFTILSSLPDVSVKPKFDSKLLQIFQVGHHTHDRLQLYLKNYLIGSWKCKSCHAIHGQNIRYYQRVMSMPSVSSDIKQDLHDRTATVSEEPIRCPSNCDRCGSANFKYAEWKFYSSNGMVGSTDGILRLGADGFPDDYGLEIKSTSSNSYRNLSSTSGMVIKYKKQFGIYLKENGLTKGIMIFENKDTLARKYLFIRLEECGVEEVYETVKKANEYKKQKRLPKGILNENCKSCKFFGGIHCKPK